MSDPYIGQINMNGFGFAPPNYALCNGQTMQVNQHQALYALIDTQFGGNGTSEFKLPDLRGRIPVGPTEVDHIGSFGGVEDVTLTEEHLPTHKHDVGAKNELGANSLPDDGRLFAKTVQPLYRIAATNLVNLSAHSLSSTGGGHSHNNMDLSMVISFVIAIDGIFPSRN